MKIDELTINNFKGIDELRFKPKMINVIVGKNNTGKTSLLEAIDLLFNTQNIRMHYDRHFSKLINVNSTSAEVIAKLGDETKTLKLKKADPLSVAMTFKNTINNILKTSGGIIGLDDELLIKSIKEKLRQEIKSEIEKQANAVITPELASKLSTESITVTKDASEDTYISFESDDALKLVDHVIAQISKSVKEKFEFEPDQRMLSFAIRLNTLSRYRPVKRGVDKILFIENLILEIKGRRSATDAAVVPEVEKRIKEYKLLENLERFDLDYLVFKNKKAPVPYDFMGDGFKAMVGLFWYLYSNTKGRIVLVEEPETHMHPGYIRELVRYIIKLSKEQNMQFFMTTHCGDLINCFLDYNLTEELTETEKAYLKTNLSIVKLEKSGDGVSRNVYGPDDAQAVKKLLIDLRGI